MADEGITEDGGHAWPVPDHDGVEDEEADGGNHSDQQLGYNQRILTIWKSKPKMSSICSTAGTQPPFLHLPHTQGPQPAILFTDRWSKPDLSKRFWSDQ
jgi:hypothetical protein